MSRPERPPCDVGSLISAHRRVAVLVPVAAPGFSCGCPGSLARRAAKLEVSTMWWLTDIVVPALLILGIYCFLVLVGFDKRYLTRKTTRTAEDMYGSYADSARKQRRRGKQHRGE